MAYCNNSHIINLLYSGKFADVNFTQSKLAKSLHLKIGAKIIKKTNINKLNYKIMKCSKFLVLLNGKAVARYSSISFAYARKRKIEKLWWFDDKEDEVEIYDTINGTFL